MAGKNTLHDLRDSLWDLKRKCKAINNTEYKCEMRVITVTSYTSTPNSTKFQVYVQNKIMDKYSEFRLLSWGTEAKLTMQSFVSVDTGNLIQSIHQLDYCYKPLSGAAWITVGVDLDPAGGNGKLYAPPMYKKSPKYGNTKKPPLGMRKMKAYGEPGANYALRFFNEDVEEELYYRLYTYAKRLFK